MIDKTNIKTTDWLTKGLTKEQIAREKREAIMSADLEECMSFDIMKIVFVDGPISQCSRLTNIRYHFPINAVS